MTLLSLLILLAAALVFFPALKPVDAQTQAIIYVLLTLVLFSLLAGGLGWVPNRRLW